MPSYSKPRKIYRGREKYDQIEKIHVENELSTIDVSSCDETSVDDTEKEHIQFKRHRHTYRYDIWGLKSRLESNTQIERDVYLHEENVDPCDEIVLIPVSCIDREHFIKTIDLPDQPRIIQRPYSLLLNINNNWTSAIDGLEESYVSKSKLFDKYRRVESTVYHLPITEILSYREKSQRRFNSGTKNFYAGIAHPNWLHWRGVFYDPSYLYNWSKESYDHKFKNIGTLVCPKPSFQSELVEEKHFKICNLRGSKMNITCKINHNGPNYSGAGWTQTPSQKYLEIDLGEELLVTHFGSCGRFPETESFPFTLYSHAKCPVHQLYGYGEEDNYRKHLEDYQTRSRNKGYITMLRGAVNKVHCITNYKIHYFSSKRKSWMYTTRIFKGNNDSLTEVVNDLSDIFNHPDGLLTRYLRIEPLNSINDPSMRIAVYGYMKKLQKEEMDLGIVKYTVIPGYKSLPKDARVKEHISKSYSWKKDRDDDALTRTRVERLKNIENQIQDMDPNDVMDHETLDFVDCESRPENRTVTLLDFVEYEIERHENILYDQYEDDLALAVGLSLSINLEKSHYFPDVPNDDGSDSSCTCEGNDGSDTFSDYEFIDIPDEI